jgi:hypothetical protein
MSMCCLSLVVMPLAPCEGLPHPFHDLKLQISVLCNHQSTAISCFQRLPDRTGRAFRSWMNSSCVFQVGIKISENRGSLIQKGPVTVRITGERKGNSGYLMARFS